MRRTACAAQIIKQAGFSGRVFAKTARAARNFIFANAPAQTKFKLRASINAGKFYSPLSSIYLLLWRSFSC